MNWQGSSPPGKLSQPRSSFRQIDLTGEDEDDVPDFEVTRSSARTTQTSSRTAKTVQRSAQIGATYPQLDSFGTDGTRSSPDKAKLELAIQQQLTNRLDAPVRGIISVTFVRKDTYKVSKDFATDQVSFFPIPRVTLDEFLSSKKTMTLGTLRPADGLTGTLCWNSHKGFGTRGGRKTAHEGYLQLNAAGSAAQLSDVTLGRDGSKRIAVKQVYEAHSTKGAGSGSGKVHVQRLDETSQYSAIRREGESLYVGPAVFNYSLECAQKRWPTSEIVFPDGSSFVIPNIRFVESGLVFVSPAQLQPRMQL